MDHSEAVEQMATERYLLGEMSPEEREAFEEHVFECAECALDLKAAAAFVDEAKAQLPGLAAPEVVKPSPRRAPKRRNWFAWLTPVIAAPAFAVLLAVIGYQNLATIPALKSAAREPRVVPWTTLHVATRGGGHLPLMANPRQGAVLMIDLPPEVQYSSYALEMDDPQGRAFWKTTVPASEQAGPLSLLIPGTGLQQGSYTLTISGLTPQGAATELDRRVLDVQFQ